jgi:hypothetical protein
VPFAPHLRLSVRGAYASPTGDVEQFQFGLALRANPVGAPQVPTPGRLDNCVQAIRQYWGDNRVQTSNAHIIREVKLAPIGPDGRYTGDPQIAGVEIAGPNARRMYPPQVALVVSTQTARRGPSGRGRVYLPAPLFDVDGSWVVPAGNAQGLADTFAAMLVDLATTGSDNRPVADLLTPVLASSKGTLDPILSVRVGRAFDTVRSRRRSLSEAYTALVPAAPDLA